MGDLAATDVYNDLDYAPYGVGSPAESAGAPSGMGALLGGAYNYVGDLAKRAFGASEQMRQGGSYNPAPIVEAAMLPMTGAVAGTGPGGFAMGAGPIKAYHSSPHDFDKFDLAKIGTGEGAQVYGHGLYFAENPAVSGQGGQYWNQFLNKFEGTPEGHAASRLKSNEFDRAKALEFAGRDVRDWQSVLSGEKTSLRNDPAYAEKMLALRQAEHDLLASGKPVGPRTYEVNINADPAHMLDWDKGLHTQSPEVRAALERYGFKADKNLMRSHGDALMAALQGDPNIAIPKPLPDPIGAQIYESSKLVPGGFRDKVRATAALQEAGIPGIKYLDQGSRLPRSITDLEARITKANQELATWNKLPNDKMHPMMMQSINDEIADLTGQLSKAKATSPSHNYVIFDPSIVDIMKKYGIAGAAPAAMGALAAQDRYQPEEKM
jgi:hypothetical protein